MSLTHETLKKLQENRIAKNLLAIEFNRSERTIDRWIEKDHPYLSKPVSLKIITRELGMKRSEIITQNHKAYSA